MDCEFVYAFVPKSSIKTTLKEQALKKAKRLLAEADTHMTLEDQRVEQDMKTRIERLADLVGALGNGGETDRKQGNDAVPDARRVAIEERLDIALRIAPHHTGSAAGVEDDELVDEVVREGDAHTG